MPEKDKDRPVCGIVMPISAIDNCSEAHWSEALSILTDAISSAGFEANIVSNADDVGIIQRRIIQNLHDNPIVVCDVSGKNPNVMFELGLRLAFDKPTIIVKDDKTSFIFDTHAIEHLEYPRDLRFSQIVDFKRRLAEKIAATHKKATSDPSFTTFLKHFGDYTVAKIDKREVSGQEFILEELRIIQAQLRRLDNRSVRNRAALDDRTIDLCLEDAKDSDVPSIIDILSGYPGVRSVRTNTVAPNHTHLLVSTANDSNVARGELRSIVRSISKEIEKSREEH